MKKKMIKLIDVILQIMLLWVLTYIPYEIFGIAGVVFTYVSLGACYLFLKSKLGKRLIDWSLSHE